jgi:hypothetical protein
MPNEDFGSRRGDIIIRTAGGTYQGNYMDDLAVDDTKINEVLKTQPSQFIFWATMAYTQKGVVKKMKLELEKYEGQLDASVRRTLVAAGEKATEATIQARIKRDERRVALSLELINEEEKMELLLSVKDAFSQRKDMIMSLGANLRAEMEMSGGLRINARPNQADFESTRRG